MKNHKCQKQQDNLGYVSSLVFRLPAAEELISQKGHIHHSRPSAAD